MTVEDHFVKTRVQRPTLTELSLWRRIEQEIYCSMIEQLVVVQMQSKLQLLQTLQPFQPSLQLWIEEEEEEKPVVEVVV
jgi:hypothetical protein